VGNWTKVTVPRHSYRFPRRCPDCLGSGPLTALKLTSDEGKLKGFYLIAKLYEHLVVTIPFCSKCAARQLRWSKIGRLMMLLAIFGGAGIAIWLDLGRWQTGLLVVVLAVPALWLMDYRDWTVRVTGYDQETVTFSFKRIEYAQEFIQQNQMEADAALE
jgi:hypothetical protein